MRTKKTKKNIKKRGKRKNDETNSRENGETVERNRQKGTGIRHKKLKTQYGREKVTNKRK